MKYDGIHEGKESSTLPLNKSDCVPFLELGIVRIRAHTIVDYLIVFSAIGRTNSRTNRENPLFNRGYEDYERDSHRNNAYLCTINLRCVLIVHHSPLQRLSWIGKR